MENLHLASSRYHQPSRSQEQVQWPQLNPPETGSVWFHLEPEIPKNVMQYIGLLLLPLPHQLLTLPLLVEDGLKYKKKGLMQAVK